MIQKRHEIGGRQRAIFESEAHAARASIQLKARDAASAREVNRRAAVTLYSVKGRYVGTRRVWDVFAIVGNRRPQIAAAGFMWQAEALECARDLTLGKLSISMGGLRGVFGRGARGLLVPERSVVGPDSSPTKTIRAPNGTLVIVR